MTHQGEHYVYRLYDKHGELIYIGMTGNLTSRMRHHYSDFINPWARYVDHHEAEAYRNRVAASEAEQAAIAAHCPPFNSNHSSASPNRRAEYEARYQAREPVPQVDVGQVFADMLAAMAGRTA